MHTYTDNLIDTKLLSGYEYNYDIMNKSEIIRCTKDTVTGLIVRMVLPFGPCMTANFP